MTTIRHIERLWNAKSLVKLSHELLDSRQEACFGIEGASRPCFVAALAMIRMDELNQSHLPLFATFGRVILAAQDRDGGWEDPSTTALCLRALLLNDGDGPAIDGGLSYLALLQREEGIWPAGPMRRMPADPTASLFILFQLADHPRFRQAVRFGDALAWFSRSMTTMSRECQTLCQLASLRWRASDFRENAESLFAA